MLNYLIRQNKKAASLALFLLYSLFTAVPAWSTTSTNKAWTPLTLNGNYGEFLYFVEPQLRWIERNNNVFDQFIGSVAGGYEAFPGLQFWFGQTISTVAQDAVPGSLEEYRSFEQIMWNYQSKHDIKINSRSRFEQRRSLDFPEWAFRVRERLTFNFPLTHNMSFELSDEIMYSLNRVQWITTHGWDQNRAYIALVQTFSKNYAFAVGYMNQLIFTTQTQADNVLLMNFRFNLPE